MFTRGGPTLCELIWQALCSTRRGYDLLAPKFDLTPFRTADEVLEPSIAAIGSVDTALDICCGTGAAMGFLLPLCRQRLVGLDFSTGMLRQAKKNLAKKNLAKKNLAGVSTAARVDFVKLDVLAMDFDSEFDVVTCFGALGHILPEDQPAFLSRIHRALKPGGRFVFVTAYRPSSLAPVSLILRAFNAIMRVRNWLIKPPFIMYYLTFLLPDVESRLQQAGFSVEVQRSRFASPYRRYCLVIATRSASQNPQ